MRFSPIASLLVGLFVSGATLTAPVDHAATATVRTPNGVFPSANVHAIPEGGQVKLVGNEIHLLDASGNVVRVSQNDNSTHSRRSTPASSVVEPLATGGTAYASWFNTGPSPINSFATKLTVPAAPTTNHGQTIFLYSSLEPASGNAILQSVLQWGPSAAGGGAFWAIASWYLVGSQTFFTMPVATSTGTVLNELITLTGSSGSSFNYVTQFTGVSGTSLTTTGSAQLVWATVTFEAYGVQQISDYPANPTVFSGITLNTTTGTPAVTWSATSDPADGITTTIDVQGATNAEITFTY